MNDPHVEKLFYVVENGDWIDYGNSEVLLREEDGFLVVLEDKTVSFELKEHHATVEAARKVIDRYVGGWELETGLKEGPGRFRLRFQSSNVVDRNPLVPPPGSRIGYGTPIIATVTLGEATGTATKAPPRPFPLPSEGLNLDANAPGVATMYCRYERYTLGREDLPGIAYFCLTVLECLVSGTNKRPNAASKYGIGVNVLKKIGDLSSNRGGPTTARKAQGIGSQLTRQQCLFLKEAVKVIIRRVAEVAANPNGSFKKITQADLPPC